MRKVGSAEIFTVSNGHSNNDEESCQVEGVVMNNSMINLLSKEAALRSTFKLMKRGDSFTEAEEKDLAAQEKVLADRKAALAAKARERLPGVERDNRSTGSGARGGAKIGEAGLPKAGGPTSNNMAPAILPKGAPVGTAVPGSVRGGISPEQQAEQQQAQQEQVEQQAAVKAQQQAQYAQTPYGRRATAWQQRQQFNRSDLGKAYANRYDTSHIAKSQQGTIAPRQAGESASDFIARSRQAYDDPEKAKELLKARQGAEQTVGAYRAGEGEAYVPPTPAGYTPPKPVAQAPVGRQTQYWGGGPTSRNVYSRGQKQQPESFNPTDGSSTPAPAVGQGSRGFQGFGMTGPSNQYSGPLTGVRSAPRTPAPATPAAPVKTPAAPAAAKPPVNAGQ
jgi:hypothetical protein